jgi:hypothetical protein
MMHEYLVNFRTTALVVLAVTGVGLLSAGWAPSASAMAVGADIGDATIASNVTTNAGNATPLQASAGTFRSLLKFDTTPPAGSTLIGAKLKVYPTATLSSGGIEVHPELDSWAESTVVWSNQPTWNNTVLVTSATPVAGTLMSIDLPVSSINSSGNTNLGLRYTVPGIIAKFSSREDAANAPQLVLTYSATSPATAISATAGSGQTATVRTAFTTQLAAKTVDASGNPVSAASVTFTAPGSGASGSFAGSATIATVSTGTDGIATAPAFTANATFGSYQVSASTPGVPTSAIFALTNAASTTPTAVDIADSYVRSDQVTNNFGAATTLTGRTSPEIDSYLKFSVAGVTQQPGKATLRLWAETTGPNAMKIYPVADTSWTEGGLTFTNKPAFGPLLATSGASTSGQWLEIDVTSAVAGNGTLGLGFGSVSTPGKNFASREDSAHAPQLVIQNPPPTNGDPVILAAGDIACSPADPNYNNGLGTATACHEKATSDLILSLTPSAVIALGDEQYAAGALTDFNISYDPTWGRFKSITHPTLGNHELGVTGASGYFDYFGDSATPLQPGCRSNCNAWYSYDMGNWHIINLNTECTTNGNNCVAGSAQDVWLQSELAKASAAHQCKLVTSHHPKWSSTTFAATDIDQLVQDMYNAHTDIYLTGHAHSYERFAPQDPSSNLDPANGITQFVVGTGGAYFTGWLPTLPNSAVHNNDTFGALKLVLHPTSADFQFMRDPTSGLFSDSGTINCH